MCFASQRTHMGPTWNPCVFAICIAHVGPICDYHYGATRGLPLMGYTGVWNNFPRGVHVFCLSKNPFGTHKKPMCVYPLRYPSWAHVWLLSVRPMWVVSRGALCFALETHPHNRWSKWSAQLECNGKVSSWEIIGLFFFFFFAASGYQAVPLI